MKSRHCYLHRQNTTQCTSSTPPQLPDVTVHDGRNFSQLGEHLFVQRCHRSAHVLRQLSPDLLHDISLQKKKEGWEEMIYDHVSKYTLEQTRQWRTFTQKTNTDTTSIRYVANALSHVLSILESTLWQSNDTQNNAKSSKQRTTSGHTQRKTGRLSSVYELNR